MLKSSFFYLKQTAAMPSAIPYIRFSSKQQSNGSSHARQTDLVTKWLVSHTEYTLSNLRFEDLGRSGYKPIQPTENKVKATHLEYGFGKLLAAIESNYIKSGDVVLIEAMDRAGRLPFLEMVPLLNKILSAGVSIITLDDGVEYTQTSANDQHLFLLAAKIQAANKYSEALSRRIKGSYQDRRAKAAAGIPIKRSTPLWLNKEGNLIEDLAPFIVQAFEDYASGLGERRIFDRIRGKHPLLESINPSTIKRWMTNSTAIGSWGDIPNVHPAAISQELWYRVQQRTSNLSPTAKTAPSKHLLTGLVKCAHCGSNYIYRRLRKSPHVMGCGRRARLGAEGCNNSTNIPVQVLDYIRVDSSFWHLEEALSGQQLSQSEKDLLVVRGEIQDLGTAISKLTDTLILIGGDVPEIQQKLQELNSQRTELEQKATVLERSDSLPTDQLSVASIEYDLLENDPLKLNALLQTVHYALYVTLDKEIAEGIGGDLLYRYHGSKNGCYSLQLPLEEGRIRIRILANDEEQTPRPITQEWLKSEPDIGIVKLLLHRRRQGRFHRD